MAIQPCLQCKRPPWQCQCFPYLASSHVPAVVLPGGTTLLVVADGESRYLLRLEIDEATSAREFRNAAPTITAWREGLMAFQGPRMAGGPNTLLEQIDQDLGTGRGELRQARKARRAQFEEQADDRPPSYDQWAQRINSSIGSFLRADPPDKRGALHLLMGLGLKRPDAEGAVALMLQRIERREAPVMPRWPVDRTRIIAALKAWRRKKAPRR